MDKRLDILGDIISRMKRDVGYQLYSVEIKTSDELVIVQSTKLTKPEVISLLDNYWIVFEELEDMYLMAGQECVKIELRVDF